MKLPKLTAIQLTRRIQARAVEIAAGEGDEVEIPLPSVIALREPTGIFGIHWALADWQKNQGLGYVKVAAAELSAQFELQSD